MSSIYYFSFSLPLSFSFSFCVHVPFLHESLESLFMGAKSLLLCLSKIKGKKEKKKKDFLTDTNHDNVQVWRCQVFCRWEISD